MFFFSSRKATVNSYSCLWINLKTKWNRHYLLNPFWQLSRIPVFWIYMELYPLAIFLISNFYVISFFIKIFQWQQLLMLLYYERKFYIFITFVMADANSSHICVIQPTDAVFAYFILYYLSKIHTIFLFIELVYVNILRLERIPLLYTSFVKQLENAFVK